MISLCFGLDQIDGAANNVEGFAEVTALRCRLSGTKLNCRRVEKGEVVDRHRGIRQRKRLELRSNDGGNLRSSVRKEW